LILLPALERLKLQDIFLNDYTTLDSLYEKGVSIFFEERQYLPDQEAALKKLEQEINTPIKDFKIKGHLGVYSKKLEEYLDALKTRFWLVKRSNVHHNSPKLITSYYFVNNKE
jgi:hypothetical protein